MYTTPQKMGILNMNRQIETKEGIGPQEVLDNIKKAIVYAWQHLDQKKTQLDLTGRHTPPTAEELIITIADHIHLYKTQ